MSWKYVQRDEDGKYRTTSSGGGGGSSTLAGLDDVDTTGVSDGDLFGYDSNSNKWIPQTPSNNGHTYSTTEQVVGTWIDGKPLYEKTINLSESNFTKANNWHWQYNYENDISNYKEVIKIEGIMRVSWNTYKHIIVLGADDYEGNNSTSNYLSFANYYRNIVLKGYPYNNASSKLTNVAIDFCQLTIQYTKTTAQGE